MIDYSKIALVLVRIVAFTAALIGATGLILMLFLDTRGHLNVISFFTVDILIVSVLLFALGEPLAKSATKDL